MYDITFTYVNGYVLICYYEVYGGSDNAYYLDFGEVFSGYSGGNFTLCVNIGDVVDIFNYCGVTSNGLGVVVGNWTYNRDVMGLVSVT